MKSVDITIKMKNYKTAFYITLLYIVWMLFIWFAIGENILHIIETNFKFANEPMWTKYIAAIAIGSIGIFTSSYIVVKRLYKKEQGIKTANNNLEYQKRLIDNILESATAFVLMIDKDFNIVETTSNIKEIIDFEKEDLIGKPIYEFMGQDVFKEMKESLDREKVYEMEIEIDSKLGKKIDLYGRIKRELPNKSRDEGYTFVFYSIATRKILQDKIDYMDSYDILTDLPNRNLMESIFTDLIPKFMERGNPVALLYIDIDDFAFVNESKGYRAGDHLLRDTANRMKTIIREGDVVSRLTQDEFVIILTNEETLEDIDRRVNEILKGTKMEWSFEEGKYIISTTIGVSLYPKDGRDFISLLKTGNLALECAKENSRSNFEYYSKDRKCSIVKDLSVVSDIKLALQTGQFEMYYQPIHNFKTHKFENAESLIRWKHPEKGYISPDYFIPIAERAGIIDEIGEFTLEQVFKQKSELNQLEHGLKKVSINISAISFSKKTFADYIKEKLAKHGLKGEEIVLELTESSFSTHRNMMKKNIEELRTLGIEISMDDFGTGYSSLARLKDLQVDYIKLDREFIVALLDENGQEVIKRLISLANALGKNVVAEGIETEEQYNILNDLGSGYGQGYFLSRPMPYSQLLKLIEKENKTREK